MKRKRKAVSVVSENEINIVIVIMNMPESTLDTVDDLVKSQAKKAGVSGKQAKKAMKMLKDGKLKMSQIAPELEGAMSSLSYLDPNATPKDKLRALLRNKQQSRSCKEAKEYAYDKTKEKMQKDKEEEALKKEKERKAARNRRKNHNKKLKELEEKLGTIGEEVYVQCLNRLRENTYTDDSARGYDKNIITLYCHQQQFTEKLSMNMDDI